MIYFFSFLVLLVSAKLFKMSAGTFSISRMNMISIMFYKDFMLMTFFGAVLIATSFDINNDIYFWGVTGHIGDDARFYGWLAIMYTFIAFPIGMLIANALFLKRFNISAVIRKYFATPTLPNNSIKDSSVFIVLVLLLAVSTLAIIYVFLTIGKMPLLYLFSGADSLLLGQLRGEAKIDFGGIVAIRDVLAINLTVLLSLILYAYKLYYKSGRFAVAFYYSVFLVVLALTYNLEKSPLFFYFFALLITRIVFYGRVGLMKVLLTGLVMISGVFIFLSFFVDSDVIQALFYRIFVAQTVAIFMGFEYFPSQHEFLGLSGISHFFASLAGKELQTSGRVLFELYDYKAIQSGTAGYIVGLFSAEAWMLFGIAGTLLAPLYVGFFVQTLHIAVIKTKKTPITVGFYAYISIKLSINGALAQFLYPTILLSTVVMLLYIIYMSNVFHYIYKKN